MRSSALLPLFLSTAALALPLEGRSTACYSYTSSCPALHVVVARGSCQSQTANKGEGGFSVVADMITSKVNGSSSTGLVYPATGIDACPFPAYSESEPAGVSALTTYIEKYVMVCPETKIALIGYSQGGQVVGDVVCGASEDGFPATKPLSSQYAQNVIAAVTFGDPAHVGLKSQNAGTAILSSGIIPRKSTASCSSFGSKLKAYCNSGDMYCASGNSLAAHLSYVEKNGAEAAEFVLSRFADEISNSTSTD